MILFAVLLFSHSKCGIKTTNKFCIWKAIFIRNLQNMQKKLAKFNQVNTQPVCCIYWTLDEHSTLLLTNIFFFTKKNSIFKTKSQLSRKIFQSKKQ